MRLILAAIAVFVAACTATVQVRGPELDALVSELLAWTGENTDLPKTYIGPTIVFVSDVPKEIESWPEIPENFDTGLTAVYRHSNRTAYFDDKWTGQTLYERSILLHEIVHHLQFIRAFRSIRSTGAINECYSRVDGAECVRQKITTLMNAGTVQPLNRKDIEVEACEIQVAYIHEFNKTTKPDFDCDEYYNVNYPN